MNEEMNNMVNQNSQQNSPIDGTTTSLSKEDKEKEAKKNISKKRIFWTIFGIDIALLIFLLYQIISLFF